ncbi:MAG: PQQ-dependent sugar dehydrogenase [Actinobacteria bacterium]|nr:PQQ-dependent sugar dehydrogenase [Actinomycetota bacterium]
MTFAPGGLLFYGERFTGEIRTRNVSTGADASFFTIGSVATVGEQGLLGLAVHPNYPSTPYVYAYVTRTVLGSAQNQVVRITAAQGVGTSMTVLFAIAAGTNHNGGAMRFTPGGLLLIATGENGDPANAQDLTRLTGKVLRVTDTGAAAAGNPFGNRVFTYGHRNMFGMARDPRTGRFWVTENGPDCNDEINVLIAGGNYAWGPSQSCGSPPDAEDTNRDGPAPRMFPERIYNPVIAPTGAAFCAACGLGSVSEGTLLFSAWNTGQIRRLVLTSDRVGVATSNVIYDHSAGLLAMARHPRGKIYVSDADQIFRIDL